MEDWKLAQTEADWDFSAEINQDHSQILQVKSKTFDFKDAEQDPVEQIHHRRNSSGAGNPALGRKLHTIPIESRYLVTSPENGNEEEPDAFLKNITESPHTLLDKQCIAQDVINIWEAISEYIILKLKRGLGTIIPGLGTFTYLIRNAAFPKSQSCKLHIYPKFFISEYVADMYRLEQDPSHHSNVPCKLINMSVLAKRIKIPRPIIEGAVTEVLQAFARGIVCNKNLEFPFPCIGKLQISSQRVKMRFYLDFYKNLKYNIEVPSTLMQGGKEIDDSVIEGRMTPLVYHIPQPEFRSVFHLREVRSVHANQLLAPVEYHKGRLIPKTLMQEEVVKEELYEYLDHVAANNSRKPTSHDLKLTPVPPSTLSHMGSGSKASRHSIRSEIEEIVANRRSGELSPDELPESFVASAITKFSGTESDLDEAELHYIYNPKALYLEQETGIPILDNRLVDYSAFTKELGKFVLGKSIKTLGHSKVYSHLKRTLNIHPKIYEQET